MKTEAVKYLLARAVALMEQEINVLEAALAEQSRLIKRLKAEAAQSEERGFVDGLKKERDALASQNKVMADRILGLELAFRTMKENRDELETGRKHLLDHCESIERENNRIKALICKALKGEN
jgi:hypothetical protein